jgi:glycosyltransferase involved in cell wall biosynthesis
MTYLDLKKENLQPLVSIIIPTYNRAYLIGETLDSIAAQNYPNWECIVVDDGSTDFTEELMEFYCERDTRFKFFKRPNDLRKGANSCRNFGFFKCRGDLVKWFDSDDIFDPNYLEKKTSYFAKTNCDLVICNAAYFVGDKTSISRIFNNTSNESDLLVDYLIGKVNINTPSILWKRSVVEGFNFDENLSRAQELDFHFRVLKDIKPKVGFIDEILIFIRSHAESLTANFLSGNKKSIYSELYVRRKTFQFVLNSIQTKNKKIMALNLYIYGFRKLYKFCTVSEVAKEIQKLESLLRLKMTYYIWKFVFYNLLVVFKITGREFRLNNHISKLKNHIWFPPQ